MCRETGPSPSHCSLGAGWDAAGGGGEGGFSQHLAGERLVAVDWFIVHCICLLLGWGNFLHVSFIRNVPD